MIHFKTLSIKNFLSYGNVPTVWELDKHKSTLIIGKNGNGKCVDKFTEIDVEFIDQETLDCFLQFKGEAKGENI